MTRIAPEHDWSVSPKQAIHIQKQLRHRLRTDLELKQVRRVAGVDVAYVPRTRQSFASVAVLDFPSLDLVESACARLPTEFPYLPGLLSFREIPPILAAWQTLAGSVDLILTDGHGLAHPRRFGIGCHLGLELGLPTIGIGKTRLCGDYSPPGRSKGSTAVLHDRGEVIGSVIRSRTDVKPIFVSVGYGLPLETCVGWVFQLITRYRLPEPIRQAHRLAEASKPG